MVLLKPTAIIYVGHQMTDGYRSKLENIAREQGVKLYICLGGFQNKRFAHSWERKTRDSRKKSRANENNQQGSSSTPTNVLNRKGVDSDDEDDEDDDEADGNDNGDKESDNDGNHRRRLNSRPKLKSSMISHDHS